MMLNKIRNKKIIKEFENASPNRNSFGDLIEYNLVEAQDKNMYVIAHIQFSNENGTLSYRGRYEIQNNKCHKIGVLKYAFYENSEPPYMKLCDIVFDKEYRNIGLGAKVINLFEERAKLYGAHYILGDLSSVDEETPANEEIRNTFYNKRDYEIIDSNQIYREL